MTGFRATAPAGVRPSPNIWHHTSTYEVENRAVDPDGRLEAALRETASWRGRTVLDLGCGSGFHLPFFAEEAAQVIGIEPHPPLVGLARRRTRRIPHVSVLQGTAQSIPLPDDSVDVVHVRWAYFFGPGAEPGLAELARVVRRGGTAMVIDNDATRSTFGEWFRRGYAGYDADEVERFWSAQGWTRRSVDMDWGFESWEDLEAVVRIEFDPATADAVLAQWRARHGDSPDGLRVDYAVNLFSKDF
ncbi:class I SAM-dependent methyltransferase [Nocardioides yefusunii]|uniref:Class I SAM-dependent methyltransferase n=1 Tax=Nocardioides yefusunii TaxID=2500546 RepID=A0ABW1QWP3_9ACTN|nr:class I SAM-dependent methyltransferase [Nocardioides yefusunii]